MYLELREKFSHICESADEVYGFRYEEKEIAYHYLWFECLAEAVNAAMTSGVNPQEYKSLFEYLSHNYQVGTDKEKECIDVALVENLYWQVPQEKAAPFWSVFPENLKKLYVSFHHKEPV